IETGTAKATFLQRLDSAIGVDLPQEIKKDINELLLHHLGPDENCIDDRVKNLLIDIFVLLSNASKPSVPDNTDFNPSEDDKNKLNDGSIINEANICETPKVAVDIDGVHCKFFTFGDSFKPGGELSNFVMSVFCRNMFRLSHPSKSKKHYFFSSIGLFFPIVKNRHWFVFAIDLKAQRFVFLDSMYDEDSICHQQIRPKLV
ncbi:Os01g0273900, partial [Oryza sativa Japonica Group]